MSAEAKSAMRRASPIHGYVGPNGSGKSMAMVFDTLPSLDQGRKVLSTVTLYDTVQSKDGKTWERGDVHPAFELLTDWPQLLEAEHCDVLLDEIVGIASSRESMGMPVQVANLLTQLRRRDIVVRWSAPHWARADKIIRECSQAVTESRGSFGDRQAARKALEAGGAKVRAWAPNRLFRLRTFSTQDFENWTSGKRERLKPEVRQWLWGPGSRAFAAYDTLDSVSRVGEVLDSGRCVHCGGRRPVPQCTCEDRPRRARRAAVEVVEALGSAPEPHEHVLEPEVAA